MISSLLILFFVLILTIFWLVFGSKYFLGTLSPNGFVTMLPSEMSYLLFAIIIPVILIFIIGLIAFEIISNKETKKMLLEVMKNSKKESGILQTLAETLLEMRKLGFTQQFFINLPFIFNDISLFLSKIISMLQLESQVVIDNAISKPQDSRLSSVCRIILSKRDNTPNFDARLAKTLLQNEEIKGYVVLFSEKYESLIKMVKQYDKDQIIFKMIEQGELGQVYNILVNAKNNSEQI